MKDQAGGFELRRGYIRQTAFCLALPQLHILSSLELWNRTTLHYGFTDSSYGDAIT